MPGTMNPENRNIALKRLRGGVFAAAAACLLLCLPETGACVPSEDTTGSHLLTLYVMLPVVPLDWESPASLYRSVRKGSVAKLIRRRQYLLGHLAIRLETPLIDQPHFSAMASASAKEKRNLVLKEKIGFGILGIGLQGKLEGEGEIKKRIEYYAGQGKIAFIRYRVSKESALEMLTFLQAFSEPQGEAPPASRFYGGAFWPGFEKEGSGCTAYGMRLLELAGVTGPEREEWMEEVLVPLRLIGGGLNGGQRVKSREILHSAAWCGETGSPGEGCIPFGICDPARIYRWIIHRRKAGTHASFAVYTPAAEGHIPGLECDVSHYLPSPGDSLFRKRDKPSLFIDYFMEYQYPGPPGNP